MRAAAVLQPRGRQDASGVLEQLRGGRQLDAKGPRDGVLCDTRSPRGGTGLPESARLVQLGLVDEDVEHAGLPLIGADGGKAEDLGRLLGPERAAAWTQETVSNSLLVYNNWK